MAGTIKYAVLWLLLGVTGVWWVDFQVDGVKRGYVIFQRKRRCGTASEPCKLTGCTDISQHRKSIFPKQAQSLPPRSRLHSIPSTSPVYFNPSSHAPTPTATGSNVSLSSVPSFLLLRLLLSSLKMTQSSSPSHHSLSRTPAA